MAEDNSIVDTSNIPVDADETAKPETNCQVYLNAYNACEQTANKTYEGEPCSYWWNLYQNCLNG